jgi:hypothetical protein
MESAFWRVLTATVGVFVALGIDAARADADIPSPRISWWVEGRPWTCSDPVAPVARQAELACDASGGHCRIAQTREEADRIAALSCAADRSAWRLDAEDRAGRVLWSVVLTGDPEARARKAGLWIARAEGASPAPPESEPMPQNESPPAAPPEVVPSPPRAQAQPRAPEPPVAERAFRRIWLGGAASLDFVAMPAATDVCARNTAGTAPAGTAPLTPGNPYACVAPSSNAPFPGSDAITNSQIATNGDLVQSGLGVGNVRLLVAVDYALTPNVLLGARIGYVLRTVPNAAVSAPFPPFHAEARATYLFGDGAILQTFAPMALVAVGLGEFDAYVSVPVFLNAYNMGAMMRPAQALTENAWLTAGPAFIAAGGGVRVLLSDHVAGTAALKLEAAFGGSANTLVGAAPELAVQVGF